MLEVRTELSRQACSSSWLGTGRVRIHAWTYCDGYISTMSLQKVRYKHKYVKVLKTLVSGLAFACVTRDALQETQH